MLSKKTNNWKNKNLTESKLFQNQIRELFHSLMTPVTTIKNCLKIINISKDDSDNHLLTFTILDLVLKYNEEIFSVNSQKTFYSTRIGGRFSKQFVNYYIVSVEVNNADDLSEISWVVRDEIRAGESKQIEIEEEFFESFDFEESFKINNKLYWATQIGVPAFSIGEFKTAFSTEVEQYVKAGFTKSKKSTQKSTWSISLPADGAVVYERYEITPEYRKARIFINTSFSWSQKKYIDCVVLRLPTGAVKGRIYQCYKDGHKEIHDLDSYRIAHIK